LKGEVCCAASTASAAAAATLARVAALVAARSAAFSALTSSAQGWHVILHVTTLFCSQNTVQLMRGSMVRV
jgi:hypothetical protein